MMETNELIEAIEADAQAVGARMPKQGDEVSTMLLAALYDEPCDDAQS